MTFCGDASLVNSGFEHARARILRCRAWTCDDCRPVRAKGLIQEIARGRPERLLTLTMRPLPDHTPEQNARAMVDAFRRLWRKVRLEWPKQQHEYFCAFEAHESGEPHLHIATKGRYLPWTWLRREWNKLTGSPGVDIRAIDDPGRAAYYVAKYMGKANHKFGSLKRYWASKGYRLADDYEPPRDGRFFRTARFDSRTLRAIERDWGWTYPAIWWEGVELIAGPRAPPAVEKFRKAWTPYALLCGVSNVP